jgi:integrase/recombinase XerD
LGKVDLAQIRSRRKTEHLIQKRKVINGHLKKIGVSLGFKEELTTYVFRYSYANIAKQLGYSKDLIAEALGHEYGNSVTGIYLEQFDQEIIDRMNEFIIGTLNKI